MKQLNIDEIRKIQLSILMYVHDFCIKNNIRYSICGGTLIGAVRHKGYIPWDDDIDIMMPRPDYEKFCGTFNDNKDSSFKILNSFNDKDFFQPFSKVVDTNTVLVEAYDRPVRNLGANIDVFPIDGLPNDNVAREKYWKKIFKKRNFATVVYSKKNKNERGLKKVARFILFYLFRLFPANVFAKRISRLAQKNDYQNSSYIACSVFGYGKKEEMPKSVFDSFVDLTFEGLEFKALQGWNTYLSNLYGDYMQLPPVEKQVAKHDFECFKKE